MFQKSSKYPGCLIPSWIFYLTTISNTFQTPNKITGRYRTGHILVSYKSLVYKAINQVMQCIRSVLTWSLKIWISLSNGEKLFLPWFACSLMRVLTWLSSTCGASPLFPSTAMVAILHLQDTHSHQKNLKDAQLPVS